MTCVAMRRAPRQVNRRRWPGEAQERAPPPGRRKKALQPGTVQRGWRPRSKQRQQRRDLAIMMPEALDPACSNSEGGRTAIEASRDLPQLGIRPVVTTTARPVPLTMSPGVQHRSPGRRSSLCGDRRGILSTGKVSPVSAASSACVQIARRQNATVAWYDGSLHSAAPHRRGPPPRWISISRPSRSTVDRVTTRASSFSTARVAPCSA